MTEVLDSSGLRSIGYVVLVILSAVIGVREYASPSRRAGLLVPSYWILTSLVLLTVAVLHATDLADALAQLGRSEARSSGWYDTRRGAQTVAVVAIAAGWLASVILAIWRVPPRRRRYLPSAVAVSALLAFIAIRAISLHQIDAIVYKSDLAGVRYVAIIELGLLVLTGATMVARLDPSWALSGSATAGLSVDEAGARRH
jgi:hypothetical protein